MQEVWKDVVGYEGMYQVSNYGNVRSIDRISSSGNNIKGLVLKPSYSTGYSKVSLTMNGNKKTFSVHRLVAECFLNYNPHDVRGLVVDHIDSDKVNNHVDNLQVVTQSQNVSKGKKNKTSKYVGVSFEKSSGYWVASIYLDGRDIRIGRFVTEKEASDAYNNKLNSYYDEYL